MIISTAIVLATLPARRRPIPSQTKASTRPSGQHLMGKGVLILLPDHAPVGDSPNIHGSSSLFPAGPPAVSPVRSRRALSPASPSAAAGRRGGVDVAPQPAPDGHGDPVALQALLEGRHPAAGLQGLSSTSLRGSGSHGPASPSAGRPAGPPAGPSRSPPSIMAYSWGDPPPGGLKIPAAGVHQLLHPHWAVDRHDPGPGLVIRGVEGNR